jgi:hypothetical protein
MRVCWCVQSRPNLTVEVSPCSGSVHLLMQGPSLQAIPWPTKEQAQFRANSSSAPNSITIGLYQAQYFITVYGELDSNFTIVAKLNGAWPYR